MSRGHYFDAEPEVPSDPRTIHVDVDHRQLELVTDRGVFSANRLDTGTEILLRYAPPPPDDGVVLDLGCGYGPITVALAVRAPAASVWGVDVNARARELTAANAQNAGVSNVSVAAPEGVPAGLQFDAMYSNPPIRAGKAALHSLLLEWLARLRPGAPAYLVVRRSLGADSLDAWLNESGWPTTRIRSKTGYRLFEVVRPPQ